MRTDACREWRPALGVHALGQLPPGEREALEAHLGRCPECRAEAESLAGVARLLPLADPERIISPAPRPPAQLRERIESVIGAERAERGRARRRRRFGFALGGAAAAAAAAVLAFVLFSGGGGGARPEQHVAFADLPPGMEINVSLQPRAFGTEIHMYVKGVRSGTLCRVFLRGAEGRTYAAGSFRYRWGDDASPVLSAALDISRTRAIGVHAGNRTFIQPLGGGQENAAPQANEEDQT